MGKHGGDRFRSKTTIYVDGETGEIFNPNDHNFVIIESQRRSEKEKDLIWIQWYMICKNVRAKEKNVYQLTLF